MIEQFVANNIVLVIAVVALLVMFGLPKGRGVFRLVFALLTLVALLTFAGALATAVRDYFSPTNLIKRATASISTPSPSPAVKVTSVEPSMFDRIVCPWVPDSWFGCGATLLPPASRPCCTFGQLPASGGGALDPNKLSGHHYSDAIRPSGSTGYVYTTKGGFVDLGHVRDNADMTKYVFETLSLGHRTLQLPEGATIEVQRIPSDKESMLRLAEAIAFADSWAHEIRSWGHSLLDASAFSPEDLPSNIIGIELGRRAILSGADYDAAVDVEMNKLMNELGAQSKAQTQAMMKAVEGEWYTVQNFSVTQPGTYDRPEKLLRRNFGGSPWLSKDSSGALPHAPAWLTAQRFETNYPVFSYPLVETPGTTWSERMHNATKLLQDSCKCD